MLNAELREGLDSLTQENISDLREQVEEIESELIKALDVESRDDLIELRTGFTLVLDELLPVVRDAIGRIRAKIDAKLSPDA